MGGWASNSKYPFLGSLRSAAQMISYEVSIGLIIVGVILSTGSLNFGDIVRAQDGDYGFFSWYWLPHFPMVILFFISALAETNRPPFDLPEAENELGAGFHTEYSGMRFGLFFLGEYVHMQVLGALVAVFFLGGWRGPWLPGPVWLFVKIIGIALIMIWMRGTLPRLRYDQLMAICWKVLVPAALINIIITGFIILI
jgi:NADH-quinone oxidoreductase subunit H